MISDICENGIRTTTKKKHSKKLRNILYYYDVDLTAKIIHNKIEKKEKKKIERNLILLKIIMLYSYCIDLLMNAV